MQRFLGRVVSSANPKTIKVCVERELRHPKTNKVLHPITVANERQKELFGS